nr:hypothetical protein [Tanacetum cinerariifolium]
MASFSKMQKTQANGAWVLVRESEEWSWEVVGCGRVAESVGESGLQGFGHFAKEYKKPTREKDYEYHKEKMILCKQEARGVPLIVEQDERLHDTDEEPDEKKLKAHYMYMEKIQEVHSVIRDDTGLVFDSDLLEKDMCNNEFEDDKNADEDESVVLANLISNLKLDTDENKKIQKQLKKETQHSLMNKMKANMPLRRQMTFWINAEVPFIKEILSLR